MTETEKKGHKKRKQNSKTRGPETDKANTQIWLVHADHASDQVT